MKPLWIVEYRHGQQWYACNGWHVTRKQGREWVRQKWGSGKTDTVRVVKYSRIEVSLKKQKPKRNKQYKPRPLVIPQMIQGYDVVASVRDAINTIRAQFDGGDEVLPRQGLADLNMVWQQCTKVHEKAGKLTPSRRDIVAAQNVLARLNADGEIKRSEFEFIVTTLQGVLAAVRDNVATDIWKDVELTLSVKQEIHGASEELWFGGALLPDRKAA